MFCISDSDEPHNFPVHNYMQHIAIEVTEETCAFFTTVFVKSLIDRDSWRSKNNTEQNFFFKNFSIFENFLEFFI